MLALDFVNTYSAEGDRLPDWLTEQGFPWSDDIAVLRDHMRAAIEAARDGREPELRALNAALRGAPSFEVLIWNGEVGRMVSRQGDEVARAMATLASSAAELLASPAARKVKACEGPGCVQLFVPAHPRRRWCDPNVCGNRVRVSRYYQRHKD